MQIQLLASRELCVNRVRPWAKGPRSQILLAPVKETPLSRAETETNIHSTGHKGSQKKGALSTFVQNEFKIDWFGRYAQLPNQARWIMQAGFAIVRAIVLAIVPALMIAIAWDRTGHPHPHLQKSI